VSGGALRLRRCLGVVAALGTFSCAAAEALAAQQREDLYTVPARARYQPGGLEGKRPLTRAERTGFTETSLHADVVQLIDSLVALGARIERGSIGKTAEGRDLPFLIASRPLVTTPDEARRLGRPIAYVQANIHAGEVEGKEAMLAMLRDLLFDPRPNVLDSLVLIVQPIYNADGNEQFGRNRGGSQNGPELVGQRHNAQDYDLNRDYIKVDAPETRGAMAMFNRWNPDLFMDLHTTDGSLHGYALTYAPTLNPAAITTAPYAFEKMMPTIRQRMRDRHGFEFNDYGDFSRRGLEQVIGDSIPADVGSFRTYESLPRYGTNYYGLRGRLSVLSEAFSHDPFPRRVASTYDFVYEMLSYLAEHSKEILALGRESDTKLASWASKPETSPEIGLQSRMAVTRTEPVRVEVLRATGDTTQSEPGMRRGWRRTGEVKEISMPMMVSFSPTLTRKLPFAYSFGAEVAKAIMPLLKIHGVQVHTRTGTKPATAQSFVVDSVIKLARFENTPRTRTALRGRWVDTTASQGTTWYVVPAGQPLGLLAMYLLEPESDDGLMSWGFLDSLLAPGKPYPIVRITAPITGTRPAR
jgi:zinc carboxypeptidase